MDPTKMRRLREQAGLTQQQVADVFGISREAVSGWEKLTSRPTKPSRDKISQLAAIYQIDVGEFLSESYFSEDPQNLVREAPAGTYFPTGSQREPGVLYIRVINKNNEVIPMDTIAVARALLPLSPLRTADFVCFAVCDHAMWPTLAPGDTVLIDRALSEPSDGSIMALMHGGELRLRRVALGFDGSARLLCDNRGPEFPEHSVADIRSVIWVGRVTNSWRSH